MKSRIAFYSSIVLNTNVHIAWTKYQPGQYVHCDISREDVLAAFNSRDLVVFSDGMDAKSYAEHLYYKNAPRNKFGLFEESTLLKSNNKQLVNIYGEQVTNMKIVPMPVVYYLESSSELNDLGTRMQGTYAMGGRLVAPEKKSLLKLTMAQVGPMVYHSDELVKQGEAPVLNVLDHRALSIQPNGILDKLRRIVTRKD